MATARRPAGLVRGPVVRSQRASLRRTIADGSLDLHQLLEGECPDELEEVALGMAVVSLLEAVPGIGPTTMGAILKGMPVYTHTRLGDLTLRQRRAVAGALRKETQ